MAAEFKANGIILPSPVEISTSDEIIWASNAGRAAKGNMIGHVIAEKKTINIKWGILTESEVQVIKDNLISGFFPFTFRDDGVNLTISSYRGTLTKEHKGYIGDGIYYYKSANVSVIQQ